MTRKKNDKLAKFTKIEVSHRFKSIRNITLSKIVTEPREMWKKLVHDTIHSLQKIEEFESNKKMCLIVIVTDMCVYYGSQTWRLVFPLIAPVTHSGIKIDCNNNE
jgi:hypothetical protein